MNLSLCTVLLFSYIVSSLIYYLLYKKCSPAKSSLALGLGLTLIGGASRTAPRRGKVLLNLVTALGGGGERGHGFFLPIRRQGAASASRKSCLISLDWICLRFVELRFDFFAEFCLKTYFHSTTRSMDMGLKQVAGKLPSQSIYQHNKNALLTTSSPS